MLQFVCDVVKDTDKEEYLCPFIRIGLDWIGYYKQARRKIRKNIIKHLKFRGGFKAWPLLQWPTRPLPYGPRRPLMKIKK